MSRQNAEIVRRMAEAWAAGDVDSAMIQMDPALEWDISAYPLPDWPNTGSGVDAFARHLAAYVAAWRQYQVEIREVIDGGEEIVLVLGETVGLKDSETVLHRDLHQVWTVHDGLAVRMRVFKTREEALRAAALE